MFSEWTYERLAALPVGELSIPTEEDRAFWDSLPEGTVKPILREAEGFIDYEFPMILATDYLAFTRTGDRNIMEKKSHIRRRALNLLVLATCITQEDKYFDTIVNLLFMFSEETFWGVSAHFQTCAVDPLLPHRSNDFVDLFAAETGCHIAFALHILSKRLNAEVPGLVGELYTQLNERILTPIEKHTDWWWQGYYRKVNNWNPWIISNVVTTAALSDVSEERKMRLYAKCLEIVSNFTRDYPADGGCDEGASYWGVAGGALFYIMEQFYRMTNGKINFFENDLIRKIAEYMPSVFVGGPYFLNYADCSPRVAPDALMLYMYGVRTGSKTVRALGASLFRRENTVLFKSNLRSFFFGLAYASLLQKDSSSFVSAPDSVLPQLGLAVFRETTDENRGFTVSVKGGHNGESHNHNDVGSLILYENGSPAVIDAGSESYRRQTFGEERYTIWTMQSGWHNLPVVNGAEEKEGKEHAADSFRTEVGVKSVATVSFAGAYPESAGLSSLVRTLSLDREAKEIAVSDSFLFRKDKNRVEEHLLLCSKPILENKQVRFQTLAGETLVLIPDPAFTLSVLEKPVEDVNMNRSWQRDSLWRLSLTAEDLPEKVILSYKIVRPQT